MEFLKQKGIQLVNLRPDKLATGLEPVGVPSTVCASESTAVHALMPAHGHLLVGDDHHRVSVLRPDGSIREAGSLGSPLLTVVAAGPQLYHLHTSAGVELLEFDADGSPRLCGPLPSAHAVELHAATLTALSVTVPSVTLSGGYGRTGGLLTAADRALMAPALMQAYEAQWRRCREMGGALQPMLAGWQLRDTSGAVVLRSTPQLLCADSGFQLAGIMRTSASTDDNGHPVSGAFTVSATGWTPQVTIRPQLVAEPWRRRIVALELLTLEEADFTAGHGTDVQGRVDSSSMSLFMPGAGIAMRTDYGRLGTLLTRGLARWATEARVVAVVPHPFASGQESVLSVAMDVDSATDAGQAPVAAGGFTAATAFRLGSAIFYGGVMRPRPEPPLPSAMALTVGAGAAVDQCTAVECGEAGVAVTSRLGWGAAPQLLPPLLVVQGEDATALRLHAGGREAELQLTAVAGSGMAYYLSGELLPLKWADVTAEAPWADRVTTAAATRHDGTVAVAPASNPLMLSGAVEVTASRVVAITQPMGAQGGWNYARQHLLVWCADGVYALSASAALTSLSASLLHGVGVERADAVAIASDCIYAASTAGRLIRLTGTRLTELPLDFVPAALGWCAAEGELWMASATGAAAMFTAGGLLTERTDVTVKAMVGHPFGGLLILDCRGHVLAAHSELRPEAVEVSLRFRAPCRVGCGRAVWHIDAEQASLRLSLAADTGGPARRLLELNVTGSINAPIAVSLVAPRRSHLTASISGRLSAPASLRQLAISNIIALAHPSGVQGK